jgi:hypothetical protein
VPINSKLKIVLLVLAPISFSLSCRAEEPMNVMDWLENQNLHLSTDPIISPHRFQDKEVRNAYELAAEYPQVVERLFPYGDDYYTPNALYCFMDTRAAISKTLRAEVEDACCLYQRGLPLYKIQMYIDKRFGYEKWSARWASLPPPGSPDRYYNEYLLNRRLYTDEEFRNYPYDAPVIRKGDFDLSHAKNST